MQLENRDDALATLRTGLDRAAAGHGRIVVVAGEAGIGKTALLHRFLDEVQDRATTLVGACDDLLTPSPLGPLREIGRRLGGTLADELRAGAPRERVHDALVAALGRVPPPVVVALEDLHWADGATLDTVTSLSRWVADRPVMLVTTHRDDEVGPAHPLSRVLARFPGPITDVVVPRSLDVAAVRRLARSVGSDLDPRELHAVTGGNPFYVTEVLAGDDLAGPPASVAFAVTARLAQLPEPTRDLLQLASLVPGRVPLDLLDALEPAWERLLEPAEAIGMVGVRGDAVAFRHELARLAVAGTLTSLRARANHGRILAALPDDTDPATLVHHAEGAGDTTVLVAQAVRAAATAAALESFPEAMVHHERALAHPDLLTAEQAFDQWYGLARARRVAGEFDGVLDAAERSVAIARDLDDPERLGRALASHGSIASMFDNRTAPALIEEAVAVTAPLGPSRAAAEARVAQAYVALGRWDFAQADAAATEARRLAREAGATDVAALAAMFLGVVAIGVDGDLGPLRAAEEEATAADTRWAIVDGYMTGCTALLYRRMHADALAVADRALEFAGAHDFAAGWGAYVHAIHAQVLIEVGRWDEAAAELDDAVASLPVVGWAMVTLRATRGRLRARRGDVAGAAADLSLAATAARDVVSFQMRFTVAIAVAEAAWLRGDVDAPPPELVGVRDDPLGRLSPPARGTIAVWLARFGVDPGPATDQAGPFRKLLDGRHADAADQWDRLGCVYEAAEARALSDEPALMLDALDVLDRLGAEPLARRTRLRLRELGERPPSGPQRRTRSHPLGLTARQAEVLDLLVAGASNASIADELVVSVRTVENHVSAILRKLDVATREEAAAAGRRATGR